MCCYCANISNESICPGLTAICILHRVGRLGAPLADERLARLCRNDQCLRKRHIYAACTFVNGVLPGSTRLDSTRAVAERLLGWDGAGARPRSALLASASTNGPAKCAWWFSLFALHFRICTVIFSTIYVIIFLLPSPATANAPRPRKGKEGRERRREKEEEEGRNIHTTLCCII